MNHVLEWYAVAAMAAAVQVGAATMACGQPSTAAAQLQPSSNNQSGASEQSPGDDVSATVDLPALYVTSVEVLQTTSDPKVDLVSVTGLVSSMVGLSAVGANLCRQAVR